MNYEKLISDFFEGQLSESEENQLFDTIANDKNAKDEFKDSLMLEFGLINDANSIIVPNNSVEGVYKSLGLLGAGGVNNSSWLYSTKSKMFLTSILSCLLTSLFFIINGYNFIGLEFENESLTNSKINELFTSKKNDFSYFDKYTTEESVENVYPFKSESKKNKLKSVSINNSKNNPEFNIKRYILNSESSQEEEFINLNKKSDLNNSKSKLLNYNRNNIKLTTNTPYFKPVNFNFDRNVNLLDKSFNRNGDFMAHKIKSNLFDNFIFRLTKTGDYYYPSKEVGINPIDNSELKNTAISVLYELENKNRIGIEYRRENIYQEFNGVINGEEVKYYQYPAINTLGVVSSIYLYNISESIDIHSDFYIGGNDAVGVLRGGLSFQFGVGYDYYFNFGLQQSYLIYSHQNNLFNNTKTSIWGGISFEL